MQNLLPKIILILILFNVQKLYSQNDLRKVDKFINYNFQNEMRIEWPAGYSNWSYRSLNESIQITDSYVSFISNNLKEIQFETQADIPLDIRIYKYRGLTRMDIHKSSRAISYLYKDSMLIFTGLHQIQLIEEGKPPVSIYFDNVSGLSHLKELNYEKVFVSLKNDMYESPIIEKRHLNKINELIYYQIGDEMTFAGQLLEQSKRIYAIGSLWGVQVAPGNIGIAVMPEFAIINYRLDKAGVSYVRSKHAIPFRVIYFDKVGILGVKYAYMRSIKSKEEYVLYGIGYGMFYLGTSEGAYQYGPNMSLIRENRNLRAEFEIGYPVGNFDVWPNLNITLGLKF